MSFSISSSFKGFCRDGNRYKQDNISGGEKARGVVFGGSNKYQVTSNKEMIKGKSNIKSQKSKTQIKNKR
jgi:hypothetical protein